MTDQQIQESLDLAMSQIVEAWHEIDPLFVAYVKKYGGYNA